MTDTTTTDPGDAATGPADPGSTGFDALAEQARELEGLPAAGDVTEPAAPADPSAGQLAEARELVGLVATIALPLLPERYAQCYGKEQQARIAEAWARLCMARGWSMEQVFGRWGPELALAAALGLPALPVLMEDLRARRAPPAQGAARVGAEQAKD